MEFVQTMPQNTMLQSSQQVAQTPLEAESYLNSGRQEDDMNTNPANHSANIKEERSHYNPANVALAGLAGDTAREDRFRICKVRYTHAATKGD